MARNLRQYLVDENTPVSPEWVRRVFGDIDARIDALEQIKADWQAAVDILTSQALLRIDEALRPAFDELQQLVSVGAFFTATSASNVAVGTGLKTFIVDEPRKNFVPAEYVVFSSAGAPDIGMAGRLVSYDPETGELVVNVELASGTGSRNDWRISVGTPPDLTHAGRTDNPHGVTPAQIGAAVEGHGHQIGDVSGLQAALDAKAAAVHGHLISDVSGLQTALDGKLDNTAAAFANRIDTLNENTAPNGSEFIPCSDGQKVSIQKIASSWDFVSGALTPVFENADTSTAVSVSAAHGLVARPKVSRGIIVNKVPEGGYEIGDVLIYPSTQSYLYADGGSISAILPPATTGLNGTIRPAKFRYQAKDLSGTFVPTPSSWDLFFMARKE